MKEESTKYNHSSVTQTVEESGVVVEFSLSLFSRRTQKGFVFCTTKTEPKVVFARISVGCVQEILGMLEGDWILPLPVDQRQYWEDMGYCIQEIPRCGVPLDWYGSDGKIDEKHYKLEWEKMMLEKMKKKNEEEEDDEEEDDEEKGEPWICKICGRDGTEITVGKMVDGGGNCYEEGNFGICMECIEVENGKEEKDKKDGDKDNGEEEKNDDGKEEEKREHRKEVSDWQNLSAIFSNLKLPADGIPIAWLDEKGKIKKEYMAEWSKVKPIEMRTESAKKS